LRSPFISCWFLHLFVPSLSCGPSFCCISFFPPFLFSKFFFNYRQYPFYCVTERDPMNLLVLYCLLFLNLLEACCTGRLDIRLSFLAWMAFPFFLFSKSGKGCRSCSWPPSLVYKCFFPIFRFPSFCTPIAFLIFTKLFLLGKVKDLSFMR